MSNRLNVTKTSKTHQRNYKNVKNQIVARSNVNCLNTDRSSNIGPFQGLILYFSIWIESKPIVWDSYCSITDSSDLGQTRFLLKIRTQFLIQYLYLTNSFYIQDDLFIQKINKGLFESENILNERMQSQLCIHAIVSSLVK